MKILKRLIPLYNKQNMKRKDISPDNFFYWQAKITPSQKLLTIKMYKTPNKKQLVPKELQEASKDPLQIFPIFLPKPQVGF